MTTNRVARGLALALLAGPSALLGQDAERATHGEEAQTPQVSFAVREADHQLLQYQLGCLSLLSYVVVSGGEAAVVDPQRDVDHYLAAIDAAGAKLRYVLLTHPHADFVAGHTELAHRTGAEIVIGRRAKAGFPHRGLGDGDTLAMGKVAFTMRETPGHTPDATTFLLRVADEPAPRYAFTGDTLFIGGIGRPDLLDVPPAELASASFDSIQRLKSLPDATLVLPAHGAGSLCGAHLSPETTSTIGREKATNPYLRVASRATFIAKVLSHQPVAPQYFVHNVAMNRSGPPLVDREAVLPPRVDPQAVKGSEAWIVDVRNAQHYSEGHIAGAINVALRGRLDTWTGIVVPFDADVYLVGSEAEAREGAFRLRRIGYDRIAGWLGDDEQQWRDAGLSVRASKLVTPAALYAQMQKGEEPIVIDVRTADEYEDLRIGEVGNIPVTEHARFGKVLTPETPVVMLCNSAYRSSMAVGLAERQGFTDVASLDGGLDAWLDAGLPAVGRMIDSGRIVLPQSMTPRQLAAEDQAALALFDLRAEWEWNDWHVPGSVNVALGDLAAHVDELADGARVVLLSRHGCHAFAAAGALLSRRPERELFVLHGGVEAYYRDVVLGEAAAPVAAPMRAAPPAGAAPRSAPVKKKRGVGC